MHESTLLESHQKNVIYGVSQPDGSDVDDTSAWRREKRLNRNHMNDYDNKQIREHTFVLLDLFES